MKEALPDADLLGKIITARRSIRQWKTASVPEDLVIRALELATWAPNSGNHQPYKIIIVRDREIIHAIADAVQKKTDLVASWPEADSLRDVVDRWRATTAFFRDAPICVAFFMAQYISTADKILGARTANDPEASAMLEARKIGSSALQTMGALISHFLLVLHTFGLGACWMTGPVQAKQEIENLLGNPPAMDFVALVPVGYPDAIPDAPGRRPIQELIELR